MEHCQVADLSGQTRWDAAMWLLLTRAQFCMFCIVPGLRCNGFWWSGTGNYIGMCQFSNCLLEITHCYKETWISVPQIHIFLLQEILWLNTVQMFFTECTTYYLFSMTDVISPAKIWETCILAINYHYLTIIGSLLFCLLFCLRLCLRLCLHVKSRPPRGGGEISHLFTCRFLAFSFLGTMSLM